MKSYAWLGRTAFVFGSLLLRADPALAGDAFSSPLVFEPSFEFFRRPPALADPRWDLEIENLLGRYSTLSHSDRISAYSRVFLGRPYLKGGPLGEGPSGRYDQDPLYRTDGFDCTTFLETIMALARAGSLREFQGIIDRIRYKDGVVRYENRNHFTELDWNLNNAAAGFLAERTRIAAGNLAKTHSKTISKLRWYASKTLSELVVEGLSEAEKQRRLQEWKQLGTRFSDEVSVLDYLPKEHMAKVLARLPAPAVLNVVSSFGSNRTNLSVSHQVLFTRENGQPKIRHASSHEDRMKVWEHPFAEYLAEVLERDSVVGFNVQEILSTP